MDIVKRKDLLRQQMLDKSFPKELDLESIYFQMFT